MQGWGACKDSSLSGPEAWEPAGRGGLGAPGGHYLDVLRSLFLMALLVRGMASRGCHPFTCVRVRRGTRGLVLTLKVFPLIFLFWAPQPLFSEVPVVLSGIPSGSESLIYRVGGITILTSQDRLQAVKFCKKDVIYNL